MKPKFKNRFDFRIFIKGVKNYLGNPDSFDCPFDEALYATKLDPVERRSIIYSNEKCVKNCGTVFKEHLYANKKDIKGCPCHTLPKKKLKTIRKRAKAHLKTAIEQYKALYR